MIISRTPLRMSFVGGGSDLPGFYRRHGGAVLSTAINKFVYVSVNRKFDGGIRLAYSQTEEVDRLEDIQHRLVRATFEEIGIAGGVEVTTTADIPSRGTGLGSSSSFTVALIQALSAYLGRHVSAHDLGAMSSTIEIDRCGEPIGKQDQYAAAFGGFNILTFNPDDSVSVSPVIMPAQARDQLGRNLLLLYTGITRSASGILAEQSARLSERSREEALLRMVELVYVLRDELQAGNVDAVGTLLDENWQLKRGLASGISSSVIDDWYEIARRHGASGGKLLGAGAGGFLLFYAPPDRHEAIAHATGLRQIPFRFEQLGSQILFFNPVD